MIVAYYGRPDQRIFGRIIFSTWDQALHEEWNRGDLYDLHDTDEKQTFWDLVWDRPEAEAGQLSLF